MVISDAKQLEQVAVAVTTEEAGPGRKTLGKLELITCVQSKTFAVPLERIKAFVAEAAQDPELDADGKIILPVDEDGKPVKGPDGEYILPRLGTKWISDLVLGSVSLPSIEASLGYALSDILDGRQLRIPKRRTTKKDEEATQKAAESAQSLLEEWIRSGYNPFGLTDQKGYYQLDAEGEVLRGGDGRPYVKPLVETVFGKVSWDSLDDEDEEQVTVPFIVPTEEAFNLVASNPNATEDCWLSLLCPGIPLGPKDREAVKQVGERMAVIHNNYTYHQAKFATPRICYAGKGIKVKDGGGGYFIPGEKGFRTKDFLRWMVMLFGAPFKLFSVTLAADEDEEEDTQTSLREALEENVAVRVAKLMAELQEKKKEREEALALGKELKPFDAKAMKAQVTDLEAQVKEFQSLLETVTGPTWEMLKDIKQAIGMAIAQGFAEWKE